MSNAVWSVINIVTWPFIKVWEFVCYYAPEVVGTSIFAGLMVLVVITLRQKASIDLDSKYLPVGAHNIQELGNGWRSYEIELYGKNRTFMYYNVLHTPVELQ